MAAVMKDGEHFGTIPGCGDKKTLLKPGAEKLAMTFRMAPRYEIIERDLPNNHREYRATCSLESIVTGAFLGEGVGVCSTMEGKYRFRPGAGEVTDVPVPKAFWDSRDPKTLVSAANAAGHTGSKFTTKKNDAGQWMIATFGERAEHDNPADYYNTCLKMSKKRAMVDAILTATAASDIFVQDVEDMVENGVGPVDNKAKAAPKAAQESEQPATSTSVERTQITKAQVASLRKLGLDHGFSDDAALVEGAKTVLKDASLDHLHQLYGDEAPRIMSAIRQKQIKPKSATSQMDKMPEEAVNA